MTANTWCKHESGRFSLKFKQVENARLKSHSFVWVKFGQIFRNATPQEALTMRIEAAKQQEPLPFAEIPGLRYEPSNLAQTRQSWPLIAEANRLAQANG